MFLAPIFGGMPPPVIPSLSDHEAKFQGDRSRDLGGNLAKEIKNITGKIEDLPYYLTGGLIIKHV